MKNPRRPPLRYDVYIDHRRTDGKFWWTEDISSKHGQISPSVTELMLGKLQRHFRPPKIFTRIQYLSLIFVFDKNYFNCFISALTGYVIKQRKYSTTTHTRMFFFVLKSLCHRVQKVPKEVIGWNRIVEYEYFTRSLFFSKQNKSTVTYNLRTSASCT